MTIEAKRLAQLISELLWRQNRYDTRYIEEKIARNNAVDPESQPDAIFFYNQFDAFNQRLFVSMVVGLSPLIRGRDELMSWLVTINEEQRRVDGLWK